MLDMFALILNIHSKQSETEEVKNELKHANKRLDAVEAKIGDINDVSEKLGLAVRQLPLPTHGYTYLDTVRQLFAEIRAPGINVNRDVIKAVRKLPANPGHNLPQPVLGTVLVEMRDEESRASIMRNKHVLQGHHDSIIQKVVIKNMKSKEQMFMENLGNNILKRVPGCENSFVTPNGQIRQGEYNHTRPSYYQQQQQNYPHQPYQPPLGQRGDQARHTLLNHNPHSQVRQQQQQQPRFPYQQHYHQAQQHTRPPYQHHHYQAQQQQQQQWSSQPAVPQPSFSGSENFVPPNMQAVPPPTNPRPSSYQDLLGRLDTLYAQPGPGPSGAPPPPAPQVLQPAQPQHGEVQGGTVDDTNSD